VQVWLHAFAAPGRVAPLARQAEEWGFDGLLVADSQNLTADVWVELALAAAATSRLGLGPGVTNPITRHVAVDADRERARELVRGSVATFARFSAQGAPATGLSEATRRGVVETAGGYEQARHGEAAAGFARRLDGEFLDRFGVCGPPAEVRARLAELAEAGIERLVVVPGSLDADPEAVRRSSESFADEVLPPLSSVGS
jgi:5,10-methylenetetrahydromethanopterin reductase